MRVKKLSPGAGSGAALREHEARGRRFGFLRRRLAGVDVEETWAQLEAALTLGRERRDPEVLGRAMDAAEANARRAGMLARVAVEELEEFELDWRRAYGAWEFRGRAELESAKREKRLSGMTTAEMVENWIAGHVPEYAVWRRARRDLERSVALTKDMCKAWENRAASLRKMVELVQNRRGVDPGMLPRRDRGGGASDAADE